MSARPSAPSTSRRCSCRRGLTGTRYIHVHRNVPGMLGRLNDVFSQRGLNIAAQHLQTDGEIGYVVIEAEGSPEHSRDTLHEIRALDGTIRARLLYARG